MQTIYRKRDQNFRPYGPSHEQTFPPVKTVNPECRDNVPLKK